MLLLANSHLLRFLDLNSLHLILATQILDVQGEFPKSFYEH